MDESSLILPGSAAAASPLEALFRAERRRLFGLAYRITGRSEDADDVVQEAFGRLIALSAGQRPEQAGAWVARVATRLAIDALRRRRGRIPY